MSVHVLLTLLNKWGKRGKMPGLPSILSLFRNKCNKLNNTRARMLDSIYHMTLKLIKNCIFHFPKNLQTTNGLSILLHSVISLPDATSCDNEI